MPATPIPRRGPQNAFTRRLAKLSDWELTSLFSRPYTNPYPRKVLVNVHVPPEAYTTAPKLPLWSTTVERDDGKRVKVKQGLGTKDVPAPGWTFQTNQVLTSKYNIVTFLPRNLLEQFRRVANIFFSVTALVENSSFQCFNSARDFTILPSVHDRQPRSVGFAPPRRPLYHGAQRRVRGLEAASE